LDASPDDDPAMTSSLRFAGAAALGAALLLTACAKKTDQTTTTTTDTQSATTAPAPAAGATAVPDTTAAPAAAATTAVTVDAKSSSNGSGAFIDMPVYPGASENKDQSLTMSANGGSVAVKVYTTGDDAKKVTDWYKSHLPAAWKNMVVGSDKATMGTFVNETGDGDQTVLVASQDDHTTRIQLTTKHGK
jgi:hypothetical protein